jgi:hypothetical protein
MASAAMAALLIGIPSASLDPGAHDKILRVNGGGVHWQCPKADLSGLGHDNGESDTALMEGPVRRAVADATRNPWRQVGKVWTPFSQNFLDVGYFGGSYSNSSAENYVLTREYSRTDLIGRFRLLKLSGTPVFLTIPNGCGSTFSIEPGKVAFNIWRDIHSRQMPGVAESKVNRNVQATRLVFVDSATRSNIGVNPWPLFDLHFVQLPAGNADTTLSSTISFQSQADESDKTTQGQEGGDDSGNCGYAVGRNFFWFGFLLFAFIAAYLFCKGIDRGYVILALLSIPVGTGSVLCLLLALIPATDILWLFCGHAPLRLNIP